jgi:protein-L-isoaspartate(D-aspartate) O-methyltransferase
MRVSLHRSQISENFARRAAVPGGVFSLIKTRSLLAYRPWTTVIVTCLCMAACNSQPATETGLLAERKKMVEEQLAAPGRNIKDRRVLEVMASVPRHEFVPEAVRRFAYWDEPLPIGYDQTISQPFIVAFMTEQLHPKPTDRVLEIGTGSGYQAAVLSRLVAEVFTIEIVEPLARQAESDLRRLGYDNVQVLESDGYQGLPEHAPFDAIIVTCAPDHVPQPLVDQLRDGGRMIIPVGPPDNQQLFLLQKRGSKVERRATLPVRFVLMQREH